MPCLLRPTTTKTCRNRRCSRPALPGGQGRGGALPRARSLSLALTRRDQQFHQTTSHTSHRPAEPPPFRSGPASRTGHSSLAPGRSASTELVWPCRLPSGRSCGTGHLQPCFAWRIVGPSHHASGWGLRAPAGPPRRPAEEPQVNLSVGDRKTTAGFAAPVGRATRHRSLHARPCLTTANSNWMGRWRGYNTQAQTTAHPHTREEGCGACP